MQEVSGSEQLHARGKLQRRSSTKFDRGENSERRQSGLFKFFIFDVRSDVKVWLDVEHTGNSIEMESSGVLQEASSCNGEQAANQPSKRFHRVYIQLHRVAVGAKRR
jgi:hypothetical protein